MRRNRSRITAPPVGRGAIIALAASLALAVAGCRKETPKPKLKPPPKAVSSTAPPPKKSKRPKHEYWKRAMASPNDPMELGRLAEYEGVAGLLEAIEEGGKVAHTALLALPYSERPELACWRISEILRQVKPPQMSPYVDALGAIANRPREQVDPEDPVGVHVAFDTLVRIARRKELPAQLRAKAALAARHFAAHGPYDEGLIPNFGSEDP